METPNLGSAQELALAGDSGMDAPNAQNSEEAAAYNGQTAPPSGTLEEQSAYLQGLNNPPVQRWNSHSSNNDGGKTDDNKTDGNGTM